MSKQPVDSKQLPIEERRMPGRDVEFESCWLKTTITAMI